MNNKQKKIKHVINAPENTQTYTTHFDQMNMFETSGCFVHEKWK